MKKKWIPSLIMFAMLLIAAVISNPKDAELRTQLQAELKGNYSEMLSNPAFKDVAQEVNAFAETAANKMVHTRSYGICSISEIQLPDEKRLYFGAFGFWKRIR